MESQLHNKHSVNHNLANAFNIINIGSVGNFSLNKNTFEITDIRNFNNNHIKDDLDDYDRVNLKTVSQDEFR